METEFHSGPTKPGCEINGEENGCLFFCNACCVRESKHVYPSQHVCNYLIRKRSNSGFISLSHDKSKNPEMNHSFLIHLRFGGWHPLNEWYTLKAAGSRKVGFFRGKAMDFTCFTLGTRQEQEMTGSQPKNDPLSWVMFEEMMC